MIIFPIILVTHINQLILKITTDRFFSILNKKTDGLRKLAT